MQSLTWLQTLFLSQESFVAWTQYKHLFISEHLLERSVPLARLGAECWDVFNETIIRIADERKHYTFSSLPPILSLRQFDFEFDPMLLRTIASLKASDQKFYVRRPQLNDRVATNYYDNYQQNESLTDNERSIKLLDAAQIQLNDIIEQSRAGPSLKTFAGNASHYAKNAMTNTEISKETGHSVANVDKMRKRLNEIVTRSFLDRDTEK